MLRVGLTGGIGSGKTLVAEVFKSLSVPVFNADVEGKKLLFAPHVKEQLRTLFGDHIFSCGEVDRSILANLVFDKPDKLTQLNAVIHPEVRKMFELFAKKNSSSPYVLHEAAILVETGYYKLLDKLILVVADADLRVDRVMKRDNVTREQVISRMKNQWDDEKKILQSDFVIYNNADDLIVPQVLNIHKQLQAQL
ncbi:MAG TPA: dephospho-CoA kinase [Bacteroidales bacterium]|nr:dephospho-CoA kinase [Bacteroidales bacterium]